MERQSENSACVAYRVARPGRLGIVWVIPGVAAAARRRRRSLGPRWPASAASPGVRAPPPEPLDLPLNKPTTSDTLVDDRPAMLPYLVLQVGPVRAKRIRHDDSASRALAGRRLERRVIDSLLFGGEGLAVVLGVRDFPEPDQRGHRGRGRQDRETRRECF
jgi:hypothetical protein